MCIPAAFAALAPVFGGGAAAATAAGATAAAGTAAAGASTLATLGTIFSVGGALIQGVTGLQAANAQVDAIEGQAKTEAQLAATEDQRRRGVMMGQIAQQRAELAARGVTLDSPTAIMLGQTAAQEMSFESQAVRSGGMARQAELSSSATQARAAGVSSMLKGGFTAAGSLLTAAPDLWPGFMRGKKASVLAGGA